MASFPLKVGKEFTSFMDSLTWKKFFEVVAFVVVFAVPVILYLMEKAGASLTWIFVVGWLSIAAAALYLVLSIPWVWADAPIAVRTWRISLVSAAALLVVGYGAINIWPSTAKPSVAPDRRAEFAKWAVPGNKLLLGHSTSADFRSGSFKLDMSQLLPFAQDYSFIVIGRVADNSVEALTDTRIETSQAFTITDEVRTIQINFSEEFAIRAQAVAGRSHQVSIQYYFAAIPKNVRPEQIHTITDITALGGQQMKSNPSPEFIVPPAKSTK